MRQRQICLVVFFCSAIFGQQRPQFTVNRLGPNGPVAKKYWGDQLLVKFQHDSNGPSANARRAVMRASARSEFQRLGSSPELVYAMSYDGDSKGLQDLATELGNDPMISWVSLSPVFHTFQAANTATPNDPLFAQQWAMGNVPGSIGWSQSFSAVKSDHVYFVVADTGACFGHQDFDWSRNFWNWNAFGSSIPANDGFGHGCAVASVVVAKANNGFGIAGLADWAQFGFVKILDDNGDGDTPTIVRGINAITQEAALLKLQDPRARVVLNLSFGNSDWVQPIADAIAAARAAGIIVVAAAGNSAVNLDQWKWTPASVPGVITVTASDLAGTVSGAGGWMPNWGPKTVLVAAPGKGIYVDVPVGTANGTNMLNPNGYTKVDGTSFSAPGIAGAIVMMLAKNISLTEDQIRIRLMNGNRNIPPTFVNGESLEATEVLMSGAFLSLPNALADDTTPPAQPLLSLGQIGHSSANILITGTGDDGVIGQSFGFRCNLSTNGSQSTLTQLPYFGQFSGNNIPLLFKGSANTALAEDTDYQFACQVVDKVGNWSAMSQALGFHTTKASAASLDPGSFSLLSGPESKFLASFGVPNPVLWHQSSAFPFFGPVWYAGYDETFNYKGSSSDWMLLTPAIDLGGVAGSVSVNIRQFLQMISPGVQDSSTDAAEIRVVTQDSEGNLTEKILAQHMANTIGFAMDSVELDLTEYAGKVIQLRFRFFTTQSSSGIGWMLGPVTLKTDR